MQIKIKSKSSNKFAWYNTKVGAEVVAKISRLDPQDSGSRYVYIVDTLENVHLNLDPSWRIVFIELIDAELIEN